MSDEEFKVDSRLRRLRASEEVRALVRETRIHASNLVAPIFVREGTGVVEPIGPLPGINRYSVDTVSDHVARLSAAGVQSVLLFGLPQTKDELGSAGYSPDGVVPRAIREIKRHHPKTIVMADVCLCEYTSHGHCGVIKNGAVDNDATLPLLAREAVEYAKAGADVVGPSAMMDGQVGAVRNALDAHGFDDKIIMSYSAKFASSFYGPFREAAGSAPAFGNRRGYQMDPANGMEAMREIESDLKEGADIVMIKPALAYLDLIAKARARFDVTIAAYSVGGEYSMVKAAAKNGWLDETAAAYEILIAIKRAGANVIITYFAEQMAKQLDRP
ncbi:MAG: porphobilinogen synthase [Nitrososphaerales archaeon]